MDTLAAINDLWDFDDPATTEARFREAVKLTDDESYINEALTQIARTQGLRAMFDEAHETLDQVSLALPRVSPIVEARYLLERGRVWNSSGNKDKARELFLHAFDVARQIGDDYLAADAAHMVAIAESAEQAIEWNLLGFRIVEASSQATAMHWVGPLANNLAWTYHDKGEYDTALTYFEKGRDFRAVEKKEPGYQISLWAVARCKRSLGLHDQALAEQKELLATYFPDGCDKSGYIAEEIAENLLALGQVDESKSFFRIAHAVLSQDEWHTKNEPDRIARLRTLAN